MTATMSAVACSARRHDTVNAYRRHGCRCPAAVEAYRERNRRDYRRRTYVRGRRSNCGGPRKGLDEAAVERAVGGDRSLRLTSPERRAAIDRLDMQGMTALEIAVLLGITTRTVQRQRARRRAGNRVQAG